jgi:hypothetical protein
MNWLTWAFWISMIAICSVFALAIVMGMVKQYKKHQEYKHRNTPKMPTPVKMEKNVILPHSDLKWAQKRKREVV